MSQLSKNDFHYDIPDELIAHHPCPDRTSCRLMVLDGRTSEPQHQTFKSIVDLLPANALLILNDTKVVPARVPIVRESGGKGEMLIQYPLNDRDLRAIGRPSSRLKVGEIIKCTKHESMKIELLKYVGEGQWDIRFHPENPWPTKMEGLGEIPLPPYIKREQGPEASDLENYQTVFNKNPGSAAAPTASLHFSEELLNDIAKKGVEQHHLTHHVGSGTFLPLRVDDLTQHQMHLEISEIPEATSQAILSAKREGRPIIAVGTTVVRALESGAQQVLKGEAYQGATDLFIYPPYQYQIVDQLITNFHLPESTLLMLVSALIGREKLMDAYRVAVEEQYRFFSYGDAMYVRP
jgi:S-adenosylmethionine:tRNA ribosyltransferase-isomerase